MKKKNIGKYGIIVIVVLGLAAAALMLTSMRDRSTDENASRETASAFIGDLSSDTMASGVLLPSRESRLSVDMPGRVESVSVQEGDWVQAGDDLVQLDKSDQALNVILSQQNLRLTEAALSELLEGPTDAQLVSAEAALANAQAQLGDLLSDLSPEEIAALEADLKSAEANTMSSSAQLRQTQNAVKPADIAAAEAALSSAQANLTSVEIQYTRNPSPDDIQANTALAQAREQLNSAQAQLNALLAGPDANQLGNAQAGVSAATAQQDAALARYNKELSGPGPAEIAAADAQLVQAEASLADLVKGPTDDEIAAAEAEVAQARIDLAGAEEALDAAAIRAPFDGLVTSVHFEAGEYASSKAVSMIDTSSLELVLEVDEADIASLITGQSAVVTFEAFPGAMLEGEISFIAPRADKVPGSSLVVYEVHLQLEDTTLPLRSGMTADANLTIDQREGVLLVPNQAISADRSAGVYSVNLIDGDEVKKVTVIIGLRDRQFTEIVDGLNLGDELLIDNDVPVESAFQESGNGRPFGGR